MILAFDTFYSNNNTAKTACVQFKSWQDAEPVQTYQEILTDVEDYTPGEFYKRELPCILSLLKQIDITNCEAIIIDGFVTLDDTGKYGLGAYLYHELKDTIPVIGVAKNDFKSLNSSKLKIVRGKSAKPLYVTAKGIDIKTAATCITNMHGNFRIPTLLKLVDTLGRL